MATKAGAESAYVFISERLAPMTAATFRKLLARAGDAANLGMPIHPHMLRHSAGFTLANGFEGHAAQFVSQSHRVGKQYSLIGALMVQQLFMGLDRRRLLLRIQLA